MCYFVKIVYVLSLTCSILARSAHVVVPRPRNPSAVFRPGVTLNRPPWTARISHPYTAAGPYRPAGPHYADYRKVHQLLRPIKFQPSHGRVGNTSPWRTSRPPYTAEYEFVRTASAPAPVAVPTAGKGAIHTIPAPNLSLSEKPIVVVEDAVYGTRGSITDQSKSTYDVTETIKMDVTTTRPMLNTFERPAEVGFSKATALTPAELSSLVKSGALQLVHLAPPAVTIPHTHYIPQYNFQTFDTLLPAALHTTNEGFLPQEAFIKPDQLFLQNDNRHLYQNYPIEFVKYQPEQKFEPQSESKVYLFENKPLNQNEVTEESHKNVIRETQDNAIVTSIPQTTEVMNIAEESTKEEVITTTDMVFSETQPPTTTIKYTVETTTHEEETTPIYYAQVGQSVGDIVAKGFYSAINDVRAAAALAQVDNVKPEVDVNSTTTESADLKSVIFNNIDKIEKNNTTEQRKFIRGIPFSKAEPANNVAYTFLRAEDKDKVEKDGAVYAGQIVEATIMEDRNFEEKGKTLNERPPLRLLLVNDNSGANTETPKVTVVKAKIPPKSKIIYDDKTGEPVLRIYASYIDSPLQKGIITSKLINMKHKDAVKKHEALEKWKEASVKNFDRVKSGSGVNQVTEFSVKLRPKLDDYISIFDEFEE